MLAVPLVVGSLLAVAGGHALLTQGQVRLARVESQVAKQVAENRQLELRVAQLEDPQQIVAQAQKQGLTAPSQVGDLAEVPLGTSGAAASSTSTTLPPAR